MHVISVTVGEITVTVTPQRKSRQNPAIREFILQNLPEYGNVIGSLVSDAFDISRTSASRYLKRLEDEGLIEGTGKTSARKYTAKLLTKEYKRIELVRGIAEDEVWTTHIEPLIQGARPNVDNICHYGFTEIFNNAIDHSGSSYALIGYEQTYKQITIRVMDEGIGIFEKIQKDFNLEDPRVALLELSKGKLTSDKSRHSGEGIFFTSRMFNEFSILSGHLFYRRSMKSSDDWGWLIESKDIVDYTQGTCVMMRIETDAPWTAYEVIEKYQNEETDFAKTHVPIALGKIGQGQLVSRSQAKRILMRFERFEEVFLDFQGVTNIGQAFADEIFRVYANAHPNVNIMAINTTPEIQRMISHVKRANPSSPEAI